MDKTPIFTGKNNHNIVSKADDAKAHQESSLETKQRDIEEHTETLKHLKTDTITLKAQKVRVRVRFRVKVILNRTKGLTLYICSLFYPYIFAYSTHAAQ